MSGDLIERVLDSLDRVVRQGAGWSARCPAHEDRHPSLSVSEGDDGRVLLFCHGGCSTEAVVEALGLGLRDLFPSEGRASQEAPCDPQTGLTLAQLATAKGLPVEFLHSVGCSDAPGPSVRIPYHDPDGNVVAVRFRMALQGARFRWRKGDHVRLYGLERLADARAAGWAMVVEGESDCWTLWYRGIPAVGIPGKNTWREEWASLLAGLEIFVWQEPNAEDLVNRVAQGLPDARVIVAQAEIKDVSDAHVRGEDIVALLEGLRSEARPAHELLDRRANERLLEAHRGAATVLAHSDPLELVEAETRAQGYGGDVRVPLLGYLAATSRLLAPRRGSMAAHALFKGPSSGGKNAAMQAGLRLLPAEAVHVIDAGSPRVLIYDDAPLKHRVIVFGEADSLPAGEDNPAASAIRNLLADGHLHYQVTVRDPSTGKFTVHQVDKPGPTVLLTTSTRPLGRQLMTRLFTIEVPDEPAQLRAALAAQAATELDDPPAPNEALVAFQRYLAALAPIDVVVPFAAELADRLGRHPSGPRVLRDFPHLLSLVKATTVLRVANRGRDARGRLVATLEDYRAVHRLVADTYEASAGASKRLRDAVGAARELAAAKGDGATVSVSELATRLDISVASAWRRVRDAIAGGWLVNDEARRSQTAKLRPGDPLPSISSLPTPEELGELFRSIGGEDVKTAPLDEARPGSDGVAATEGEAPGVTPAVGGIPAGRSSVFTFSPDPAEKRPPSGYEGGGHHPPVDAENVQTADRGIDDDTSQAFTPPFDVRPSGDDEWIDVDQPDPRSDPGPLSLWDLP